MLYLTHQLKKLNLVGIQTSSPYDQKYKDVSLVPSDDQFKIFCCWIFHSNRSR